MTDPTQQTIEAARRNFNSELLSPDYPQIHGNDEEVRRLVTFVDPRPAGTYLDLATGNGDVAFAIADHQPEAQVIGVDIADKAITRNQSTAKDRGRLNVTFRLTDGRSLDFPDDIFHGVASRYAFHHFPDAGATLAEARRVLQPAGSFVLADAVKKPEDRFDFINRFQELKPDGHVRMYTTAELIDLFRAQGFLAQGQFGSAISFTRELNADYRALIEETPREILDLYDVTLADDRVAVRFDVISIKFLVSGD